MRCQIVCISSEIIHILKINKRNFATNLLSKVCLGQELKLNSKCLYVLSDAEICIRASLFPLFFFLLSIFGLQSEI